MLRHFSQPGDRQIASLKKSFPLGYSQSICNWSGLLLAIGPVWFWSATALPGSRAGSGTSQPPPAEAAPPRAASASNVRPARFERLATLPQPEVKEASGLVRSRRDPTVFYTVRDANNPPHLYAIDLTGRLRGVFFPEGVTNQDWEAITADANGDLYIGDIGSNQRQPRTRTVYKVNEPDLPQSWAAGQEPLRIPVPARYQFSTDEPGDSETLFFVGSRLYLVTKERDNTLPTLYHLPLDQPGQVRAMEKVAKLAPQPLAIADGAVSPAGRRLALVSKHGCAIYRLPDDWDLRRLPQHPPLEVPFSLFKIEGCAWENEQHLILIGEDGVIYRLTVD